MNQIVHLIGEKFDFLPNERITVVESARKKNFNERRILR